MTEALVDTLVATLAVSAVSVATAHEEAPIELVRVTPTWVV